MAASAGADARNTRRDELRGPVSELVRRVVPELVAEALLGGNTERPFQSDESGFDQPKIGGFLRTEDVNVARLPRCRHSRSSIAQTIA